MHVYKVKFGDLTTASDSASREGVVNPPLISRLLLGKISKLHLVNMLRLLWKCLRPPLIGGGLIGSQRFPDQKEPQSWKFGDLTNAYERDSV